jgi:GNAT superfamily N-acetyltransferase
LITLLEFFVHPFGQTLHRMSQGEQASEFIDGVDERQVASARTLKSVGKYVSHMRKPGMTNIPIVRAMRPEDAAGVLDMACELAAAVGDPEPSLAEADLIRDGTGPERWFDCLVADVAGRLVAYALVCKGFEAHTAKKRLWVGDFYVRPDARRNGIGHALMRAVARHALQLGCDAVYWELWRLNTAGEAFYRGLGAEEAVDLAVMRFDRDRLAALVL